MNVIPRSKEEIKRNMIRSDRFIPQVKAILGYVFFDKAIQILDYEKGVDVVLTTDKLNIGVRNSYKPIKSDKQYWLEEIAFRLSVYGGNGPWEHEKIVEEKDSLVNYFIYNFYEIILPNTTFETMNITHSTLIDMIKFRKFVHSEEGREWCKIWGEKRKIGSSEDKFMHYRISQLPEHHSDIIYGRYNFLNVLSEMIVKPDKIDKQNIAKWSS